MAITESEALAIAEEAARRLNGKVIDSYTRSLKSCKRCPVQAIGVQS